jgi:hypothetical protein
MTDDTKDLRSFENLGGLVWVSRRHELDSATLDYKGWNAGKM